MRFGQLLARPRLLPRRRGDSTGRSASEQIRRIPDQQRRICKPLNARAVPQSEGREGPSTDFSVLWRRLRKLALPYWTDSVVGTRARWSLVGVIILTAATTGVSVMFNMLGRDYINALSEKNVESFTRQLFKYLGGFVVGLPIFVFKRYFQIYERLLTSITAWTRLLMSLIVNILILLNFLATEWRQWMSNKFLSDYFKNRMFYKVQATAAFDNPDQRISVDVEEFTTTALDFVVTILNASIDLISFSGILFSIYPPLFIAMFFYAVGGTWLSIRIGRSLVGLNFGQKAKEADFRFGLVRLRENAESIAFYGGEKKEQSILIERLRATILNYKDLLVASRNLDFFAAFYRHIIMLLPVAVVSPLFFRGEIGFGVVTQCQSAFNHVLSDISLIVYQFKALAGFSAVVDRLGEFAETVSEIEENEETIDLEQIQLHTREPPLASENALLSLDNLTLLTPDSRSVLVQKLSFELLHGQSLLITGPSGAGKTSLLRAVAGLWTSGSGSITRYGTPIGADNKNGTIMFVPQKPYLVLGTLREQLLYPTWTNSITHHDMNDGKDKERPAPADFELEKAMITVNLGDVLRRCREAANGGNALDVATDWASQLSVGEQQRLAFARVVLSSPQLLIMDESTSALDITNEQALYKLLVDAGISFVSVGHRPTLRPFHSHTLHMSPATSEESGSYWSLVPTETK